MESKGGSGMQLVGEELGVAPITTSPCPVFSFLAVPACECWRWAEKARLGSLGTPRKEISCLRFVTAEGNTHNSFWEATISPRRELQG